MNTTMKWQMARSGQYKFIYIYTYIMYITIAPKTEKGKGKWVLAEKKILFGEKKPVISVSC